MRIALPVTVLATLLVLLAETAFAVTYDARFSARFVPEQGYVEASIEIRQPEERLSLLDFNAPEGRFSQFRGDGTITREGSRLIWEVPPTGGRLAYRVQVDHRRRGGAHDARMTDAWAVLRLDNLFPAARAVTAMEAWSRSILHLEGPANWSFETPYGPAHRPAKLERRRFFTRPVGWMVAGDLGIRRSEIAGRHFVVAGPRGENFRRMDMLAFLHWTVPELVRVAPFLPSRVLIVGGSEDMWRGGLSGPGSLYLHPARPLVSGNGTSTLLHELMHVAMQGRGDPGDDWIVEGIPEYYSLLILLRSGGISGDRFERALTSLKAWADRREGRLADPSRGADTAYAVLLFRDLDLELAAAGSRLDEVVRELFGGGQVNRSRLTALMEAALGRPSEVLTRALPGAPAPG
jgi:hypothetical protein